MLQWSWRGEGAVEAMTNCQEPAMSVIVLGVLRGLAQSSKGFDGSSVLL